MELAVSFISNASERKTGKLRLSVVVPFCALLIAACTPAAEEDDALARNLAERSEALADQFQGELMGALTAAMEAGGPAEAIAVCADVAPAIADRLSAESGASVRRTALRVRNPKSEPDFTEARVMTSWMEAPLDEDGRPKRWSGWEDGSYRYLRAIPTMPMCLACHGSDIAPEVSDMLREHYPEDQATGFAAGELRGAFSIRWEEGSWEQTG